MVAIPLSVLALAAGVYLLVKVKREFLGGAFEILAWLIIVLSLVSVGFAGFRAMHHDCCGRSMGGQPQCHMEKRVIIMNDGMSHCCMDSSMSVNGCKMEGDSAVMDPSVCEKMMGKEACQAMLTQHGRCIMSKEECMQMCHAGGKACCAESGHGSCAPADANGEKPMCHKPKQ